MDLVTEEQVDAALAKLEPGKPRGTDPAPALSGKKRSGLAEAWSALTVDKLLPFVASIYGEGWSVAGNRLEGPCPSRKGECAGDPRPAYVYPSANGTAPHVHCHHEGSCGFDESLFEAVERSEGTRLKAARRIKVAAGLAAGKKPSRGPAESEGEEGGGRASTATKLVELAEEVELFRDPEGNPYATLTVDGHQETYRLRSKLFRAYLARRFYETEEKAPGNQALADALSVLEGKAGFRGPERKIHLRIAGHEGAIYLDLGGPAWDAIEVSSSGWRVVASPPVRFQRSKGVLPLPSPIAGGSIEELRRFVNLPDEDAFYLLVAWILAALKPTGPYPVLVFTGEQGSAKSTASRVVRSLVDPSSSPLRTLPREERDLMIASKNSWCVGFDNLSAIPAWISDALCRLATGGGFATRELYSDDSETIFDAQRPVLVNGIDDLATRPDLLDRAIILNLPTIRETARRPESDFWKDFEAARPRILGALLDGVAGALRRVESVRLDRLPRMADFAKWGTAAEPALGWAERSFLAAYTRNRGEAVEVGLDADPVAGAVRSLLASKRNVTGTATDLLEQLSAVAPESAKKTKDWPRTAKLMGDRLRRLAPPLRAVGIEARQPPRTGKGGRLWVLERTKPENSDTTDTTVTTLGEARALPGLPVSGNGVEGAAAGHASVTIDTEEEKPGVAERTDARGDRHPLRHHATPDASRGGDAGVAGVAEIPPSSRPVVTSTSTGGENGTVYEEGEL